MDKNFIKFVNPFMGTKQPGNCLVGPFRPFAMVRLGPDSNVPQNNNGYQPGDPIIGFSHTHVSGTGGPGRYGNIRITPFTGNASRRDIPPYLRLPLERNIDAIPKDEKATVGYYSVNLQPWNIHCELTTTKHVGVHRYTYNNESANILLDAAACISNGQGIPGHGDVPEKWDSVQASIGGWMQVLSDREIIGRSDFRGGWGHDKSYSVYFYYKSDVSFEGIELMSDGGLLPTAKVGSEVVGSGIRGILSYPENFNELNIKVGISFVSVANARSYVKAETEGKSFDEVKKDSENEWNQLLSSVRVSGGKKEDINTFYSSLYHLFCMPTDLGINQENPNWQSGVRNFTDFYCLWDSIRNANSFFHLFYPDLSKDILNSLLDIAEHTGWLPDAHIANNFAYMQSACACAILFSEAAIKGIKGIDYDKALKYLRKNNECTSPNPLVKGRYIEDYNKLGYLSTNIPKGSVSRHIEYTYHDWCIAQLASYLGDETTAETYYDNSKRIWNLWNNKTKTFYPKDPEGNWVEDHNPWQLPPEPYNNPYSYEGGTAVWSFNVFQDFKGLIERVGGREKFIKMLDRLFAENLFDIKETRMHIPHLYSYAGRPDLAAEHVLKNLKSFSADPTGLPDNEDMGCQSGYYIWHALGLYPIYGQEHYMLTPPLFDNIEAKINHDKKINITVQRNGEGKYIKKVMLGDKEVNCPWILHDDLIRYQHLHFVLDDDPSDWANDKI